MPVIARVKQHIVQNIYTFYELSFYISSFIGPAVMFYRVLTELKAAVLDVFLSSAYTKKPQNII